MYEITNKAKGPRGLWSRGRLVWLQPGETKTFMPDHHAAMLRNRDFEAEPVGEVPEPPADLAKAVEKAPAKKPAAKRAAPKRRTARKPKATP